MSDSSLAWMIVSIAWVLFTIFLCWLTLKIQRKLEVHPDGKRIFHLSDYVAKLEKEKARRAKLLDDFDRADSKGAKQVALDNIAIHMQGSVDPLTRALGDSFALVSAVGEKEDK